MPGDTLAVVILLTTVGVCASYDAVIRGVEPTGARAVVFEGSSGVEAMVPGAAAEEGNEVLIKLALAQDAPPKRGGVAGVVEGRIGRPGKTANSLDHATAEPIRELL